MLAADSVQHQPARDVDPLERLDRMPEIRPLHHTGARDQQDQIGLLSEHCCLGHERGGAVEHDPVVLAGPGRKQLWYAAHVMTRDEAVDLLRKHAPEIRSLGVSSLALFGSVARDEATDESDVDILVDFKGAATFDAFMDLRDLLEQALGRRVDLVTRKALKPILRPFVERDLVAVA